MAGSSWKRLPPGLGRGGRGRTSYNLRPRRVSRIPSNNNNAVVSLFDPLTHSQLTNITLRKIRVRGLHFETTSATLRSVFAPFGELKQALVIQDIETGKSTCFGLVVYKHVNSALLALKDPCKVIDGSITVSALANDITSSRRSSVFIADNVNAGGNVDALVAMDTQNDMAKPKILIRGTFGGNSCGLVGPGGIQGYGGGGDHGMALSAQVQGSGDGVRVEVVEPNQQSSMQGSFVSQFGNGGPSASSSNGGNTGGLGLHGGLAGGSFRYGVLGPGLPLGDSQHGLNLSLGGGSVMSSFGSSVGGMELSTSGDLPPSSLRVDGVGFSGDVYLGWPGASYDGKGSGREAGLGTDFGPFGGRGSSYGGTDSGGGSQAPSSLGADSGAAYGGSHFGGPGLDYGGTGSGGGVELGTGVGGAGPTYGGICSRVVGLGTRFAEPGGTSSGGGAGLGSGFGGLGPLCRMSPCGLSPGSMKTSSGGAHYSLSSGSADETQQQKKKYQVDHDNL